MYPGEWNRYLCLTALIFLGKLNYDLLETLGFSKFLDQIGVPNELMRRWTGELLGADARRDP